MISIPLPPAATFVPAYSALTWKEDRRTKRRLLPRRRRTWDRSPRFHRSPTPAAAPGSRGLRCQGRKNPRRTAWFYPSWSCRCYRRRPRCHRVRRRLALQFESDLWVVSSNTFALSLLSCFFEFISKNEIEIESVFFFYIIKNLYMKIYIILFIILQYKQSNFFLIKCLLISF